MTLLMNIVGVDIPIGVYSVNKLVDEEKRYIFLHIKKDNRASELCVVSSEKEEIMDLKEGYIIESRYNYILKKMDNETNSLNHND